MTKLQSQVEEFHIKHELPIRTIPVIVPALTEQIVRISLMMEELSEYITATRSNDITEMVDALGDLLYITYGTAVTLGVDMEPIMDEIHRSNMTKSTQNTMDGKVEKGLNYDPPSIRNKLIEQRYKHATFSR